MACCSRGERRSNGPKGHVSFSTPRRSVGATTASAIHCFMAILTPVAGECLHRTPVEERWRPAGLAQRRLDAGLSANLWSQAGRRRDDAEPAGADASAPSRSPVDLIEFADVDGDGPILLGGNEHRPEFRPPDDLVDLVGGAGVDSLGEGFVEAVEQDEQFRVAGAQFVARAAVEGTLFIDWMDDGPGQRKEDHALPLEV